MGGNNTTVNNTTTVINQNQNDPNAPTPKLIETMLNEANNLVQGSKFPVSGNPTQDGPTLSSALKSIADSGFLNQYQYGWQTVGTVPLIADLNNPSMQPISQHDFVNVPTNSIGIVTTYIDQTVFPSASGYPLWAITRMLMSTRRSPKDAQFFMAATDMLLVNAIYGRLGDEFNNLDLTPWTSTGFFLAMTCSQPLYSKLSDIFGRKACIIFSYVWFVAGSVICGFSQSMEQFIAARTIQGCGAAGIQIVTVIYISDVVSTANRGLYPSGLNMINATGQALGATIGGLLADTIGWRWAFFAQAILLMFGIIDVVIFMVEPREVKNLAAQARRIDILGAILLILAALSLLFGLDAGGKDSFSKLSAFVPLLIFPILLLALVFVETKVAIEPFVPPRLLSQPTLIAIYVQNFALQGSFIPLLFYIPFLVQAVERASPTQTGFWLLPTIAGVVFGTLAGGFLSKKLTRHRPILVVSSTIALIGALIVVLTLVFPHVNLMAGIYEGSTIFSIFGGLVTVVLLIALITKVGQEDQAVATATIFLFRSIGGAVGISLTGTVTQKVLGQELERRLGGGSDAEGIAREIKKSFGFIDTLNPERQGVARQSYKVALRAGFALVVGMTALTPIGAAFTVTKK